MSQVILDIPDDTMLALKLPADAFARELRIVAAAKLYELGRLSSGVAARLAGLPRVVFLARLADYGVNTFDLSQEDLENEAPLG